VRLKVGDIHLETRRSKRGKDGLFAWNETFDLKLGAYDKTLTVEVYQYTMLKKRYLGTITLDLTKEKELGAPISHKLTKVKDQGNGRYRGELELTVDIGDSSRSPRGKKGPTLKDLEKSIATDIPTSPHKNVIDPSQHLNELTTETLRVVAGEVDVGTLRLSNIACDVGTVRFTWEEGTSKLELYIPRNFSWNSTYVQHPNCRCELVFEKLKLRAWHRVKVTLSDKDQYALGILEGKAISETNRNVLNLKAAFKIEKERVEKVIKSDDMYDSAKDIHELEILEYCFKGQPDKVKACLDRWDDVNVKNENEETPLHKAVTNGNEEVVRMLIERGAEPGAVDKFGSTPITIAEKYNEALVPLLRTYQ